MFYTEDVFSNVRKELNISLREIFFSGGWKRILLGCVTLAQLVSAPKI